MKDSVNAVWTEELLRQSAERLAFRCTKHSTSRIPCKLEFVRKCLYLYAAEVVITGRESWNLLTSRIPTQRFVWTGNWCLVSFVFVVVVGHVP